MPRKKRIKNLMFKTKRKSISRQGNHDLPVSSEHSSPSYEFLRCLLTNYGANRRKGESKTFALAVNNKFDSTSDSALSLDNWLRKHSGYNLLNKRSDRWVNFNDHAVMDSSQIDYCRRRVRNFKAQEIVIFLVTHGSLGLTFTSSLNGTTRPREWIEEELRGAMQFANFINGIKRDFGVSIKGVILNSCYSAAELIQPDNIVPSTGRLISTLLPNIPVVGFTGACADGKITKLYSKHDLYERSASRDRASVLYHGGTPKSYSHDLSLMLSHAFTTLAVRRSIGHRYREDDEADTYYSPCNIESLESILRLIVFHLFSFGTLRCNLSTNMNEASLFWFR